MGDLCKMYIYGNKSIIIFFFLNTYIKVYVVICIKGKHEGLLCVCWQPSVTEEEEEGKEEEVEEEDDKEREKMRQKY